MNNRLRVKNRRMMKNAYATYHAALKRGLLKPPGICEHCGNSAKIHGHHSDYAEPLKVNWLCASCHMQLHAGTLYENDVKRERQAENQRRYEEWKTTHPEQIGSFERELDRVFEDLFRSK